ATGLTLLAFLGNGYTHKTGKYQKSVKAGLEFLVGDQVKDGPDAGRFASGKTLYAHAIAATALCEGYGMTRDKSFLLEPCQRAINFLQDAQGPDGGWRYYPKMPGDTSITGWVVQALHTARLTKDVVVRDAVLRDAEKFLDRV